MSEDKSSEETQGQRGLQPFEGAEVPVERQSGSVKLMAQEYAPAALACLGKVMSSSISDPARVSAAVALLDRAYGKPAQAVTGEDGGPIEMSVVSRLGGLSYLELKALISEPEKLG